MTYENILQNWSEYKQECYADSTGKLMNKWAIYDFGYNTLENGTLALVDSVWYVWSEDIQKDYIMYSNSKIVDKKVIYSHKSSSFEGFMEFLEKKYGQNN
jgi:hypothetical protein